MAVGGGGSTTGPCGGKSRAGPMRGRGGKVGLNCMLAVNHDVPSSRESY